MNIGKYLLEPRASLLIAGVFLISCILHKFPMRFPSPAAGDWEAHMGRTYTTLRIIINLSIKKRTFVKD